MEVDDEAEDDHDGCGIDVARTGLLSATPMDCSALGWPQGLASGYSVTIRSPWMRRSMPKSRATGFSLRPPTPISGSCCSAGGSCFRHSDWLHHG